MITDRMPWPVASEPRARHDLHLRFAARDLAVRAALQNVRRWMAARDPQPDLIGRVELVLAEMLNNITEHGYAQDANGWISLRCRFGAGGIVVAIMDSGQVMPCKLLHSHDKKLPDMSCMDSATLPEGGFGWFLIHQLTQDLRCQRDGNCNRVSFLVPYRDAVCGL
jgi:serine/threonine-protein kinase RsbW